jgi:hypothetical protein
MRLPLRWPPSHSIYWPPAALRNTACVCGRAPLQVMDALAMQFPDDTFDLVWACESGEHMPDKKK